jgi:hypothetical protein
MGPCGQTDHLLCDQYLLKDLSTRSLFFFFLLFIMSLSASATETLCHDGHVYNLLDFNLSFIDCILNEWMSSFLVADEM